MRLNLKRVHFISKIYKVRFLSEKLKSNIIYSNNSWSNVINTYNLQNNLEIIVREQDSSYNSDKQRVASRWFAKTSLIAIFISLVGNIPVQSRLLSAEPNIKSFAINSEELNLVSTDTHKDTTVSLSNDHTTTSNTDLIHPDDIDATIIEEETLTLSPQELALPQRALQTYAGHTSVESNSKWKTYHVKNYDNLTNIFYKIGHQSTLKQLQKDDAVKKELTKLVKGTTVRASSSENGKLSELIFSKNNIDAYVLTKIDDDKYSGTWKKNIFEIRQSRSNFVIRNGLFFDGKKAGIDKHIIKQIVKVFDWDIDFSHDIRVGDKITAVFEEIYHDGDIVGYQNLLAAEFVNKGKEFRAIQYTFKDGKSDYFTPAGREMKKAFIRTPISHARVSSHFNPGRFHPKLHKIRAHKGTDFAARRGTAIMATGNGTIKFIGRKGGYGRTVIIKHREGYSTTYAHMSKYKKKLKVGAKVYQGDVIGYVGSSGLATGPHLHYEFHKDGKAIDSMRAALPNSMSLSSRELQDFRNKAINLVLQLNVLKRFAKAKIEINSAFGG